MFNFFKEIKENLVHVKDLDLVGFKIINLSGKFLYIEGHLGLLNLSRENVSVKIKHGAICVDGQGLILEELSENTLKISGKITKVEQV